MSEAPRGRPESLWPLFAGVSTLKGVGPKTAQAFEQAGMGRPRAGRVDCAGPAAWGVQPARNRSRASKPRSRVVRSVANESRA